MNERAKGSREVNIVLPRSLHPHHVVLQDFYSVDRRVHLSYARNTADRESNVKFETDIP